MNDSETWGTLTIGGISAVGQYIERVRELEAEIGDLKHDLRLNASMLARQNDMAREAEGKQMDAEKRLAALQERLAALRDALESISESYDETWLAGQIARDALGKPGESGSQAGVRSET